MIPIEKRRWIKDGKKKLAVIRTRQEEQEEQIANDILAKAADKDASKAKVQKFYEDEMKDIKKTASKAKVCINIYDSSYFSCCLLLCLTHGVPYEMSQCFVSLFTKPFFFFLLLSFLLFLPLLSCSFETHYSLFLFFSCLLSLFSFPFFTIITERHGVDGQC